MKRRTAVRTVEQPRIPPAPGLRANCAADTSIWVITHRIKANFFTDCDALPAAETLADVERLGTDYDKAE